MENTTCWQTLAASVIGPSHLRNQTPGQDACCVEIVAGKQVIAAVADGLGSARWAERGAQCAVQAAVETLQARLIQSTPQDGAVWQALLAQAFAQARSTVEKQATAENNPLPDYASTLIIVSITEAGIASGQLGDGAVVGQLADAEFATLSPPQRGEFANETIPLTCPDALTLVYYGWHAGRVEAAAIFTDGVQNLCLAAGGYAPHAPFFAPLFAQIQSPIDRVDGEAALTRFLQSERISKRSDDDKTLVLIGRVV